MTAATSSPHRLGRHLVRRLAVAALAATGALAVGTSTAGAGGWAVTTLDAIPAPAAGETVEVGFTIRQHGVTPVALDEDVAIEITAADGAVTVFPAAASGAIGHYAASVTFPSAGTYDWAVHQGWFGEQDLGDLTVGTPSVGGESYRYPTALRYGLPVLAVALAALAIVDAAAGRRRRRAVAL